MYILFINLVAGVIYIFSAQFNNNSNKKKIVKPIGSTQPNPIHVSWVGLM